MARKASKSKSLISATPESFFLSDMVFTSMSCERFVPVEDSPRGSVEFKLHIDVSTSARKKVLGALVYLTATVDGFSDHPKGVGTPPSKEEKKAFTTKIKLEAFFANSEKSLDLKEGDEFTKKHVHHFANQVVPVLTTKIYGLTSDMGYRSIKIPLTLTSKITDLKTDTAS